MKPKTTRNGMKNDEESSDEFQRNLIEKIVRASNHIHRNSIYGSSNYIVVNQKTYDLLMELEKRNRDIETQNYEEWNEE